MLDTPISPELLQSAQVFLSSVAPPVNNEQDLRQLSEIVSNVMLMRSELINRLIDPRRSIEDECGYPKGDIDVANYQNLYDRDAIAVRVVQVLPKECWQVQPLVYEEESADPITAFERDWRELGQQLRPNSYYQDENENLVWEYLRRVDELSGIGQFGIMLVGIDDGKPLSAPVDLIPAPARGTNGPPGTTNPRRLLYLRVFPQSMVDIAKTDTDMTSPRFGHPISYNVRFSDPRGSAGINSTTSAEVHWTRVIHIADNLDSNEILGAPRMRPVMNRLLDLQKLYGGSAEMYWRGAFPGLSLETHPQLSPKDMKMDDEKLRSMMENYANGLQRYLALLGMTAKSLAPQVVDPTPQIRVQIEAICIRLGVPKRIFMGSERGELASVQDDKTWNDRLKERQRNYITPRIVVPFVDRLIHMGVLSRPKKYRVLWPDMTFQTEADKARVAIIKAEALIRFAASMPNPLITPNDFWTRIMNLSDSEARTILDNVSKWFSERPGVGPLLTDPEKTITPSSNGNGKPPASTTAGKVAEVSAGTSQGTFIKPMSGQVVTDPDQTLKIPSGSIDPAKRVVS